MLDKSQYPKYEPNNVFSYEKNPTKEDVPYLLEHVFDLDKKDYVTNSNQVCYYSPVSDLDSFKSIESTNPTIFTIENNVLFTHRNGSAKLILTYDNGKKISIKVVVYKGSWNGKLLKDTLFIVKDSMINVLDILKHIHCKHYDKCIMQQEEKSLQLVELQMNIDSIRKQISDYQNIIVAYRNNEIVYHKELDEYYTINIIKNIDDKGKAHHQVKVEVVDNFINRVKDEIKLLEFVLRDYSRMESRYK